MKSREWIVLPSIALITILALLICTEYLARWLYPVAQVGFDNCFATDDPTGTAPVKPHGVCSERMVESKFPVEYRYNGHGDRDEVELDSKQQGAYRIVMIGSSMAMGLYVPRERSFAATLPTEISRLTGRHIELYNMAAGGKFRGGPFPTASSMNLFGEAISAKPDVVLWVITPMDLENVDLDASQPVSLPPSATPNIDNGTTTRNTSAWDKLANALSNGTLKLRLEQRWEQTRTFLVLRHLLLANESQSQYVDSYLKNEDDAGFLKVNPSIKWQSRLRTFAADAEKFATQTKAAGIPFVAVLIPNRAQATMISHGTWPDGYDPYKLGDSLRAVIESNGGVYIDVLADLRLIPNPEQHYFPVDGHLDADGHAMISKLLARKIAGGAVPDLKAATQRQSAPVPAN